MDQCGKNQDIMNKKDKELNSALIDGKQSKTQLLKCKNEYINLEQHCKTQKSKFEVFEQKYCKKYAFEKRSGFQEVNDAIIFN